MRLMDDYEVTRTRRVTNINFGKAQDMVDRDFLLGVLLRKGLNSSRFHGNVATFQTPLGFMDMWLHFKHLHFPNRKQRGLS